MIHSSGMKGRLWILCLGMLVPGLTMILPGSTLTAMMERFSLEEFRAGLIGTSFFFAGLFGILATSILMARMGARKTLGLCCALSAISLLAMAAVPDYYVLLLLYFAVGLSFGVLVTLPGVVVNALSSRDSAGPLNLVYGFFALGVVIEPLIAGWMLERGMPWWAPCMAPAAVSAVAAIAAFAVRDFPEPELQAPLTVSGVVEIWDEMPIVLIVGVGGTLLYVASEVSLNVWIPTFLRKTYPENIGIYRANVILTLFWVGLTGGRWLASPVLGRINPAKFLIALASLGAATIALSPQMGDYRLAQFGLALSGLWYSAMYPTLTSYTGRLRPQQAGAAFSLMAAGGQVGATVFPAIVGAIAQSGRFPLAMSAAALPLAALAVLIFVLMLRGDV